MREICSISQADCVCEPDVCTKIVPRVQEPTPGQWARFNPMERALLERTLREPVEYFDDPLFHLPEAGSILFGAAALADQGTEAEGPGGPRERRRWRTLDPSQEYRMFQQFNYARMQQLRILRAHAGERLSVECLRELLRWAQAAVSARSRIAEANTPLVMAMARRVEMTHVDFCELLSEGNLALLRCISKFDSARGFKFSTYACRSILKSFARVAVKVKRYKSHFPAEYSPALDPADRERDRDEAEAQYLHAIRIILRTNRAELTPTEQTVIRARFLLNSEPAPANPLTLKQIGRMIGVTKERVRQIQNRALAKLRHSLRESVH